MLRHEKMISKMSLEQRVRFLISQELYKSATIDQFSFPIVSLESCPVKLSRASATAFPTLKQVASTWNDSFAASLAKFSSIEAAYLSKCVAFNLCLDVNNAKIGSDDNFINATEMTNFAMGIKENELYFGLDASSIQISDCNFVELSTLPAEFILEATKPDFITVKNEKQMEFFNRLNYKNNYYAIVENGKEACKMLSYGATLLYYFGDDIDGLTKDILNAINGYNKEKAKMDLREDDLVDLNNRVRSGEIISEMTIDKAVDNMIELICKFEDRKSLVNDKKPYEDNGKKDISALEFDREKHAKFCYEVAKQSVVMLKNDKEALPVDFKKKVAIIGDCAYNKDYAREMLGKELPDEYKTAVEEADATPDLEVLGFAHGYLRDASDNSVLVEKAVEIAKDADVVLLYLYSFGSRKLDQGQINLVGALRDTNAKVVGILTSDRLIDLSFADNLDALLIRYQGCQFSERATLDIVTGAVNPSGKLAETYEEGKKEVIPAYSKLNEKTAYPFGFGMSYTKFVYSSLECTTDGVTFTVTNTGDYDGYEVAELYVRKKGSKYSLGSALLKGYVKVFAKKGESVKAMIAFDDKTFRYFDTEKKMYGFEGGTYEIMIGSSSQDIRIKGKISIKRFLNEQVMDKLEIIEDKNAINDTIKRFHLPSHKPMATGWKIFLTLLVCAYFIGLMVFIDEMAQPTVEVELGLFAFGIIVGLVGIIVMIRFAVTGKKRGPQGDPTDSLTKLVGKVKDFKEMEREVYYVPPVVEEVKEEREQETVPVVTEVEQETVPVDEEAKPEELEEEIKAIENIEEQVADESSFEEETTEEEEAKEDVFNADLVDEFAEVKFNSVGSINELYTRFIDYAKSRGIEIEPSSTRALFAAIASGGLIILDSKTKDLLDDLLLILNDYFAGHCEIHSASGKWTSSKELYWTVNKDNGQYVPSPFTKSLNSAIHLKENLNFVMLNKVRMKNIKNYFSDYIDFTTNPTESKVVHLNKDLQLKLTKNIRFIVVPYEANYMETMPRSVANCAICVDLIMQPCEPVHFDDSLLKVVSYNDFEHLVSDARANHFLEENEYKKMDDFEDTLNKVCNFVIGNKNALMLEKYVAAFIECGGDQLETSDYILISKLIPMIKTLKIYKDDNGESYFLDLLDKVYGRDNLSKAMKYIGKIKDVEPDEEDEIEVPVEETPVEEAPESIEADEGSISSEAAVEEQFDSEDGDVGESK